MCIAVRVQDSTGILSPLRARQVTAGDADVDQPNEFRVMHENEKKGG